MIKLKLLCREPARKLTKMSLRLCFLCLTASFITACDTGRIKREKAQVEPPPFTEGEAPPVEEPQIREVAKPAITAPAHTAPKGLKTTLLFPENNLTLEARFTRLEHAVQDLSSQMTELKPSIDRLIAVDEDMNLLMRQLEILTHSNRIGRPGSNRPGDHTQPSQNIAGKPHTKAAQKTAQAMAQDALNAVIPANGDSSAAIKPVIKAIRIADHADKTRIVFDSSQKLPFKTLRPAADQLAVDLSGIEQIDFLAIQINNQSRIIRDIFVAADNSALLFDLQKPMAPKAASHIPPDDKHLSHRYYIDLKE